MVIYDRTENNCRLYEIKHTDTALKEQCRHLLNDQECERIQKSFGCIVGKTVLYRGTELHSDWDMAYRSAAEFLEALPAGRP